jgi:NAD(P)-dependent dehydrogenase (short-subunit alcohol dehydrogenase family)
MKEFKDKVAVITGAASGIGLGLAHKAAKEGMKVVLADIEESALLKAEKDLESVGADVITVLTDVSKANSVETLAQKTIEKYGVVHLLFNNAGVGEGGILSFATLKDFQWVIGVNLWGVIHGIHAFMPILLSQKDESHIVNTTSGYGMITGAGIYGITKFGVTALTENLSSELRQLKPSIKVSLLIPGIISTNIVNSERNRPDVLQNKPEEIKIKSVIQKRIDQIRKHSESLFGGGITPDQVASTVFQGIRDQRFYIFTDQMLKMGLKRRMRLIMRDLNKAPNIVPE